MLPFLLIILLASSANAKIENLIVGGKYASLDFTFYVSLEYLGNHVCGGSIITNYHIITSAQCQFPLGGLRVRTGTSIRGRGGYLYNVARFDRHENYQIMWNGIPVNDIAIVKVTGPFINNSLQTPVALYDNYGIWKSNLKGLIIGFGVTNNGALAKLLQVTQVSVVPEDTCRVIYLSNGGLHDGQFCAGNLDNFGQDVCDGDTGGPIIIENRLAGVISWNTGCAKKFYPSVYTDISYYIDWIYAHIR